jgi:NAD(P)H-nitrite reductase large subunit
MKRHVIIGGGPAGINAIETIRELESEDSSITLISDEPAYSRMALPYFIAGEIPENHLLTGDADYFQRLKVQPLLNKRVTALDSSGRKLTLADRSVVEFDDLLIATGSSALRPNIPGADQDGVYNLWTLQDARQVTAKGQGRQPQVVLVGAGFIGFIILNAMHKLGWKLSVVEIESHVLPRMLERAGAGLVENWLRDRGVQVYTGAKVLEISQGEKKSVRLSDGQTLSADVVILATGIRANVDFLAGSGIIAEQGILVNNRMETNVSGIYAAGDVAQGPDLLAGARAVHAIQPTAVDHGRVAGANMAGKAVEYPGSLIINVLDVAGLHCTSFGLWQKTGPETTVILNPGHPLYRKLVWQADRIVGALFVGPVEDTTMLTDVGMVKGLIQAKAALGEWKKYIHEKPWDLRRPYIASKAAVSLLGQKIIGKPSQPRAHHFAGRTPRVGPTPYHASLVGTRPTQFDQLPVTPTPGIGKRG